MNRLAICLLVLYFFTILLGSFTKKNESYLWYDKYALTKTYNFHDYMYDVARIKEEFFSIKPLLIFIKLVLFAIWPFVKTTQITITLLSLLYFILIFPVFYSYGWTLVIHPFFTKDKTVQNIRSFLIFFLFKNPVCTGYKRFYTFVKILNFKKKSPNTWKEATWNLSFKLIVGLSIKTIHNIDVIAIAICDIFYNEEGKKKGKRVWGQILVYNLYQVHSKFINTDQSDVKNMKIITSPYLMLNPFIHITKRLMLNHLIHKIPHKGATGVHQSENMQKHATAFNALNAKFARGAIATHKPLKGQTFIKKEPIPNHTDKRDQYYTLNNVFETSSLVEDRSNLIKRTKLDVEYAEILSFMDIFNAVGNDKKLFVQTKEGNFLASERVPRLEVVEAVKQTALWTNVRIEQYNLLSDKEKIYHKRMMDSFLLRRQKHYFFNEGRFTNKHYFENELIKNTSILKEDKIHTPFVNAGYGTEE